MTRWGKPTKNKRRTNPRYRLDEFISMETGADSGRVIADLLLDKYYEAEGNQSVSGLKSWIEANREELARWLHGYIEDQASYDSRFSHDDPAHSLESIIDGAISIASKSTNWTDEGDAGAPPMAENKTKQPTTKTLMEGFKRFLNEDEKLDEIELGGLVGKAKGALGIGGKEEAPVEEPSTPAAPQATAFYELADREDVQAFIANSLPNPEKMVIEVYANLNIVFITPKGSPDGYGHGYSKTASIKVTHRASGVQGSAKYDGKMAQISGEKSAYNLVQHLGSKRIDQAQDEFIQNFGKFVRKKILMLKPALEEKFNVTLTDSDEDFLNWVSSMYSKMTKDKINLPQVKVDASVPPSKMGWASHSVSPEEFADELKNRFSKSFMQRIFMI